MKAERISHIITDVCNKLDINYCSINPDYTQLVKDAQRLGEIFLELKVIAEDLDDIVLRHKLDGLSKLFEDDIQKIRNADHHLIKFMNILTEERKNVA